MDDNKKTSRVIVKGPAWKRIDSALGGTDEEGNVVDRELNRSYALLLSLFDRYYTDERLATRFVLLNTNTSGGYEELLRIEELARNASANPDAKAIAKLCRKVIRDVLDELDRRGYWLGWGDDREEAERQRAVGTQAKPRNVKYATIALYYELMARSHPEVNVREYLTAQHFGLSMRTVRRAVKASLGNLAEQRQVSLG